MTITLGIQRASLAAQSRLDAVTGELNTAYTRLSSGQRINRASDDAAGLSVAMSLTGKSRILNRATLNLSDAGSLLNIADAGLSGISDVITRMAELAQRSANGPLSESQRRSAQREFAALDAEIRRITDTSSFNGIDLLRGTRSAREARDDVTDTSIATAAAISANGRYRAYYDSDNQVGIVVDGQTGQRISEFSATNPTIQITDDGTAFYASQGVSGKNYYRVDRSTGISTLVFEENDSSSNSVSFAVSADGSRLAYQTTATELRVRNLLNGTEVAVDTGVSGYGGNVFLSADGSSFGIVAGTTAIAGSSDSGRFRSYTANSLTAVGVDNDGRFIISSSSNLSGQNGSGFRQFFALDVNGNATQLSFFSRNFATSARSMSFDGTSIYFAAAENAVNGSGTAARQIFRYDSITRQTEQLTSYGASTLLNASSIVISADGSTVAFAESGTQYGRSLDIRKLASEFDFEAGFSTTGRITTSLSALRSTLSGLGAMTISSANAARSALDSLNSNLTALANSRSIIGAGMSRIEIGLSLARNQAEVMTAARTRITDADIAEESARLITAQIRQQAATSVLAQARTQPELALTLLGS